MSKMISSGSKFSKVIVILLLEGFMDSIVPVWTGLDWVRKIRVKIPMRDRMRVSLWRFAIISFEIQLCLCLLRCDRVR